MSEQVRIFAIAAVAGIAFVGLLLLNSRPYGSTETNHSHAFWDVEQNPHVHILPPDADTTDTSIRQYMPDGSVNPHFVPGGNSSEYLGGFF
mgnify:CR=1 FL=1